VYKILGPSPPLPYLYLFFPPRIHLEIPVRQEVERREGKGYVVGWSFTVSLLLKPCPSTFYPLFCPLPWNSLESLAFSSPRSHPPFLTVLFSFIFLSFFCVLFSSLSSSRSR
jgi:hypothetical protein